MNDSSENSLPIIYAPLEQQTIGEYLQRYTDDDLREIFSDPNLSIQIGNTFLDRFVYIQEETAENTELQKLWKEMKQMENYGRLKQFVEDLRFVREKLLISLDHYATYIERYAKFFATTRLICSVGDIIGSVAGMFMKDSQTCSTYSGKVFTTAAALGFTGTLSTVAETYLLLNASDDIRQQVKRDQKLYDPIKEWFQQTERLKQAMLNVFPFDKTEDVLQDFSKAVNSETEGAVLLVNFFQKVVKTDVKQLRNKDFLKKITCLFAIPDIADLFKLVFFHPVPLEISKMMLELNNSSLTHMFYQHIPSLSPCQQTFWSPPVWGRLCFNFMSTLHAFKTLKRSEISALAHEMRYLRKHLEDQLKKLNEITNYAESKRNEAINMAPNNVGYRRNEAINMAPRLAIVE